MSERNLAPYFLAIGPLLLVGAYMNWPAADAIGIRGTQSLIGEADSLMLYSLQQLWVRFWFLEGYIY